MSIERATNPACGSFDTRPGHRPTGTAGEVAHPRWREVTWPVEAVTCALRRDLARLEQRAPSSVELAALLQAVSHAAMGMTDLLDTLRGHIPDHSPLHNPDGGAPLTSLRSLLEQAAAAAEDLQGCCRKAANDLPSTGITPAHTTDHQAVARTTNADSTDEATR